MKSYEEMTDSVFQRMGEYAEKQKRRRTAIKRAALPLCCCAVLVCCFGAGKLLHRGTNDVLTDVVNPTGVTDTVAVGQTEMEPMTGSKMNWETAQNGHWKGEAAWDGNADSTGADTYFTPMQGTDSVTEPYIPIPMISDYACEVTEVSVTPGNGEVILSPSLRGALEEYGSEARYRIVTLEYRDGVALEPENVEAQEALAALAGDGIVPVVETMYQDGEVTDTLLSLHASAEALEAFPADADYGYYLKLYGEFMPDADEDTVVEAHSFGMMK